MAISSIKITGLFGYFNHDISLKTTEKITIIHGANGVGKTTILRLLYDLFSLRLSALREIPFKKIRIRLRPKGVIEIERKPKGKGEDGVVLQISYTVSKKKVSYDLASRSAPSKRWFSQMQLIEHLIENIERVGRRNWVEADSGEILDLEEVLARYGELLPSELRELGKPIPAELRQALKETNVYLIETQRLVTEVNNGPEHAPRRSSPSKSRMTVEEYAEDMAQNIQARLRESGTLAASLDRGFPKRILETVLPPGVSEQKIRELYQEQNVFRNRLMEAGLMDFEEAVLLPSEELKEMERKVLWIYLTDVTRKFDVFQSLLSRAELLREIINSRFSYKYLQDRQK